MRRTAFVLLAAGWWSATACMGSDPDVVATSDGGTATTGPDGGVLGAEGGTLPGCSEACALGCNATACKRVVPQTAVRGVDTSSATATFTFAAPGEYAIDTATGKITKDGANLDVPGIGYAHVAQEGDPHLPGIAVLSFAAVSIDKGARVVARGADALAIVAKGDVVINGTLSVRPVCGAGAVTPGGVADVALIASNAALGGAGADGKAYENGPVFLRSGAGGGGNGSPGGAGAAYEYHSSGSTVPGGAGGPARSVSPFEQPILLGGWPGGGTNGGAGGGALQLVAGGTVRIAGTLDGGGCGGRGAQPKAAGSHAGGGGGAGGTILVDAAAVTFAQGSFVLAKGGGGGGGRVVQTASTTIDGSDGSETSVAPASGGKSVSTGALTSCGDGQTAELATKTTTAPSTCSSFRSNPDDFAVAAGGGGGIGIIAVRSLKPPTVEDGAVVSPTVRQGAVVSE